FTRGWTRELVEGRGWRYEVWSEPPAAELGNIRFLAGFRNPRCSDGTFVESIRQHALAGRTLGEALSVGSGMAPARVRSTVFHLLGSPSFLCEGPEPLTTSTILTRRPRA